MKTFSRLSSLSLVALVSHCGSARDVGQQAVDQNRATLAQQNNNAGAGGARPNEMVIAATGASTPVARPVSMGRDDAPTLTTVRGRESAPRTQAAITAPDVSRVPGVVPPSGGFVVRRAGSPTTGTTASTGVDTSVRTGGSSPGTRTSVDFSSDSVSGSLARPDGDRRVSSRERDEGSSEMGDSFGFGGLGRNGVGGATGSTAGEAARPIVRRSPSSDRAVNHAGGRGSAITTPSSNSAPVAQSRAGMIVPTDDRAEVEAPPPRSPLVPVSGRIAAPTMPTPVGIAPAQPPVTPPGSTITVTTTVAVTPPTVVAMQEQVSAGLLTAASVGDADRFGNYLEYLSRHEMERGELNLDMSRRLRVRVVDATGRGVNAARVHLASPVGNIDGLTHGDGSFDIFPNVSLPGLTGPAQLNVQVESLSVNAEVQVPAYGDGQAVVVRLPANIVPPAPVLDLGFLIDVTGSMGDELRYINQEVASIVHRVEQESPGVRVRLSATFYRDRTDELVVQQIPFTSNIAGFAVAMQNVYASGGGDYPEDMNAGLDAAMNRLSWSEGAAVRVLVLVADAPPQHYGDSQFTYREAMTRAAQRGIRFLPVAASGSDRRVEYLFRAMGAYTSTPYVYLTDDSGVGGPHMEADTDRVAVERFNDALVRLVTSDLRGQGMHEPGRLSETQ